MCAKIHVMQGSSKSKQQLKDLLPNMLLLLLLRPLLRNYRVGFSSNSSPNYYCQLVTPAVSTQLFLSCTSRVVSCLYASMLFTIILWFLWNIMYNINSKKNKRINDGT
eukprot:GHVS01095866.1.p1 GENE.GHVS01095866.1~~GHVS01095866.1.p1  ORF type:complete len:108 (+),score=4.72 GHVS01095866.1:53-376(+)